MNILFITHYSSLYGANRSLLLLLKGLKAKNINLLVFVPKAGPLLNELDQLNIPYRRIRFWAWMGDRKNFFFVKGILRLLLNILILPVLIFQSWRFKPSIIYTNSSITPIGIYLAILFRKPHIWHIRELGKEDYNLDYDFGKKYFYSFMKKSDAIICISEFVKRKVFFGEWKNIFVVNNAVYSSDDIELISSDKFSREDSSFIFLMMNVIHPSKRIEDAIQALAKLKIEIKDVKLIICGGGEDKEYRNHLDELINKSGLEKNVIFKGFIEKPGEMYKNSDAVLVCSRNEAWGRVAAEAMFYEKPAIGFNRGGTKEIIQDKLTGLLYENIDELVSCMKTIINEKEFAAKIKSNARDYALSRFSNKEYTEKIFGILSKFNR